MFHDSELIHPLYDVHRGGPPRAFECQVEVSDPVAVLLGTYSSGGDVKYYCAKVTETLVGMRAHQRIVHGIVPQGKLDYGTPE
jgi:protein involved in ribonucleotide reduction